VILFSFDLIELNGDDLRANSIEQRKARLAKIISGAVSRIQLNEYIEEDGALVFDLACWLGFEGIVSKRKGSQREIDRWE
jgi:bifunctional non-homologous end joining protein LigD